jgi:hypothetical protein
VARTGKAGLPVWLVVVCALMLGGLLFPAGAAAITDGNMIVQAKADIPAQEQGSSYSGQVATVVTGGIWPPGSATVTIDWGDGTPLDTTTGTISDPACGPWVNNDDSDCGPINGQNYALISTVSGSHTFARPGPYTIVVTVSATYNTTHFTTRLHTASGQATVPAVSGTCNILGSLGFAKMQTLNGGCITSSGTTQTSDPGAPVKVDGLELDPAPGVSLTLDSSTGKLTSSGGNVTLKLGCGACGQHQTTFVPHPVDWRVVPNPGETSIDEGSPGHFQVSVGGQLLGLPALSMNSIVLLQNQTSNTNFTVGLPIPSLASFFGTIKATATILSDNVSGAHFDGLDAEIAASQKPVIKNFKVAEPFKAFSGHLKFTLSTNTWYVSLMFDVPGAGGVSASTQITNGEPTEITFDGSYNTPGLAIGDTGAFLQNIHGSFIHYPHVSHPKIGLIKSSGDQATDAARASECATINTYYAQYIALNTAFPPYCGKVGSVDFDPPLEIDGGVRVSAGPVIGTKSALVVSGDFRYVDTYNDGTNTVPWLFNVQGGVTMLGLPFNRTPAQVYPNSTAVNKSSYVPVNNSGKQAWATIHGDGLVEAGGGFDYQFPQNTGNWFIKVAGDVGVSLVPKGAAIGSPAPGSTPDQYANVVQSHANSWSIVGTVTGQVCAQIPSVASGCATGAAGISNNGVAGCASFTIPGSQVIQAIAIYGAKAINAIAEFGQQAATQVAQTAQQLADQAKQAANTTANYISNTASDIANSVANGATNAANTVADGASSAASTVAGWFGLAHDLPARDAAAAAAAGPLAHAASGAVVNENITIPDVNYSIGAIYHWSGSTDVLTTCSHDALVSALSARDRATISKAGRRGVQVRVVHSGKAPRLFVITGTTAAPDVIVMGPDRRAIRTYGPGFIEPGWVVYKDKLHKKTYVDATAAPAGKWDFVAAPHTSLIANVQTAAGASIPTVKLAVRRAKHHRFAVVYRVFGRARGDRIALEETDGTRQPLTVAKLGGVGGTITWTPSKLLPGSKRVLIAVVTHDGVQVAAESVALLNLKQVAKKPKPKSKAKPKHHKTGTGEPPGDFPSRDHAHR